MNGLEAVYGVDMVSVPGLIVTERFWLSIQVLSTPGQVPVNATTVGRPTVTGSSSGERAPLYRY